MPTTANALSDVLDRSEDHLIREEIPKDIDNDDKDSTGADRDEDIDELDPFSDAED